MGGPCVLLKKKRRRKVKKSRNAFVKRVLAFICAFTMIATTNVFGGLQVNAAEESEGETTIAKTWDLYNDTVARTFQKTVGSWDDLVIDTTATDSKLATRVGNWAQFNIGTIIKVPVPGPCVITVDNYDTNYTIDGEEASAKKSIYTHLGDAGYVEVKATANSYISSISRSAFAPEAPYTWDIFNATEAKTIQKAVDNWNGLVVDATATDSKLAVRVGNWAQFNAGTIIKVPVLGASKITVVGYDNKYTIAGEDATAATTGYTYFGKAGYVEVVASGNTYISSIKVEDFAPKMPYTWDMFNATAAEAKTIQSAVGDWKGLVVDATSGKLAVRAGNWAQFNAGTIIKVPVAGPCKLTVNGYDAQYTINEEAAKAKDTEYLYTGNAGYVEVKSTGGSYLSSIKIEDGNFATAGEHNYMPADQGDFTGITFTGAAQSGSKHGYKTSTDDAKINIRLSKKANITVESCCFNNDKTSACTIEASSGVVSVDASTEGGNAQPIYNIMGASAGNLTITVNKSGTYIHKINIEYIDVEGTKYKVNLFDDGNGTVSANVLEAEEGQKVTLTQEANDRYRFKEWKIVSGNEITDESEPVDVAIDANNKFTMPAYDVAIKGIFEAKVYHGITLTSDGNGTVSANTLEAAKDDKVTLSYKANDGYKFKEWQTTPAGISIKAGSNELTMPDEAVTVKAIFEQIDDSVVYDGQPIALANKLPSQINIPGIVIDDTFMGDNADPAKTNSHGIYTGAAAGSKITVNLKQKANIQVITCGYCAGTAATLDVTAGDKVYTVERKDLDVGDGTKLGVQFDANELAAGKTVLTFGANIFIHSISIEYVKEIDENTKRLIDVWDIGGVKLGEDATHINYITKDTLGALKIFDTEEKGKLNGTPIVFDDLTIAAYAGDRYYNTSEEFSDYNNGTYGFAEFEYEDGYKSTGAWYANGTGGAGRRYMTVQNVQAGDKLIVYGGISQSGPSQIIIEGQGTAAPQKAVFAVKAGEFQKMEVVAEKTGTFKIYESGAGKPFFHRVVRVPAVKVSGTIDFGTYTGDKHTLKFINQTTRQVTIATLEGNKFKAALGAGYDYTASLSGASGFGISKECKNITVTDAQSLEGVKDVALVVVPRKNINYTGSIKGFAEGYDTSKLIVTMVPDPAANEDDVELTINSDGTFAGELIPEVEYTATIAGVNDYEINPEVKINSEDDVNSDINVALKPMYEVKGAFAGAESGKVTALSFKNVDDNYTYDATVTADGYSINLRDGSYASVATVDGYTTRTHVIVNGANVTKDLMFVSKAAKPAVDKVKDVYVGYADKANNYATVREAMDAISRMGITSEADRVTVHIAPGTYREQIIVTTPYVSFVNDTNEEVLLTWYYGIGYKYYSADADGYYNPENAYDKFDKHIASRWGVAVYVKSTATGFRAEGITFENSFNRYITDEEIEDAVECNEFSFVRKYGVDVTSKAATERAAALCVEGENSEFKNCKFYSSQDTLYTQANCYFKDCFIEGQTDYIFGSGNCVFDTCELSFKGYSANSQGGYVTANRPVAGDKGYLFRNCSITANKDIKQTVTPGYYGRPWGADASVYFINTKLETEGIILPVGYYEMSGAKPEDANYNEYNTVTFDGKAVDTSKRAGKVMTKEAAEAIKVSDFLGSWTPVNYKAEGETLGFEVEPAITDNGDINTPYPGHTLTVGYSLGEANNANDASSIKWYAVKDGKETLVKNGNAVTGKTYKIARADVGAKIKVVVTPETVSGRTADSKSAITEFSVLDGYEDPSNPGGDAVLGDGVNIFLAGDSTVKDYRASGIFSGNSARNEGSWGEYLQDFFDDKNVTVVNYANGGRSTRNYINEGTLNTIAGKIQEGDYLFIQFGHNDCADGAQYIADRYVPVGEPDANGIYPTTPGVKVARPAELDAKYGDTCYTWDCGGTYKWYLKQFIDVARNAGATPVLVTPVSRLYYNADGTIKPHHHDSKTTGDSYVTAVKQLGEEENVLVIDAFNLTKDLFEKAYKDCGKDTYGKQLMNTGDTTHNNKLGGFLEAALMADAILDAKVDGKNINIATAVKTPARVNGVTTDDKTVVAVDKNGKLIAYDINSNYDTESEYWNITGQAMLDKIAEKVKKDGSGESTDPTNPTNPTEPEVKVDPANPTVPVAADVDLNETTVEIVSVAEAKSVSDNQMVYPVIRDQKYTGDFVRPAVKVKDGKKALIEGKDYIIRYKNNVKASNEAKAVVVGLGQYKGEKEIAFKILPKKMSQAKMILSTVSSASISKEEVADYIKVYDGVKLLALGDDYTIQSVTDKKGKSLDVVLEGTGNYSLTKKVNLKVVNAIDAAHLIASVSVNDVTYTGKALKDGIVATVYAADGSVVTDTKKYGISFKNNKDAGCGFVTITGKKDFKGTVTVPFTIKPADVKLTIDPINKKIKYNGKPQKPTIKVTAMLNGKKVTLRKNKDYRILYINNVNEGTATVSITAINNFAGCKADNVNFTILPKK